MFFFSSGLRADFSLRCSEGSRTQSSREIWTSSCFMQITAVLCQHSWQTQRWMPIKQSALGWNEHCVGLRARAALVREWHFSFFQWNHIGHQIMICMVLANMSYADKTSGGCHYKWAWTESLWFRQIVHSEGVGGKKDRTWNRRGIEREGRKLGGGFRLREESRWVKRRGLRQISNSLLLWSHRGMQEGYARVRQTGWANEAGLLGQDMMSKLGDSVWWFPIEVTEGIKDDESNFACPSFPSLQTYPLDWKHNLWARMVYFYLFVSLIS